MRILIVSQYFWPEAFRINEIAEFLVARGHAVTVLTGEPNYPEGVIYPDYRRDKAAFSSFAGARVLRVPIIARGKSKWKLIANYVSFVVSGSTLGAAWLTGSSFDVILVCQLSPVSAALPALLVQSIKNVPVVMWVLDLWPETLSAIGVVTSRRSLGAVSRLVSFIYRRCDRILVQSRAFVASVERHGGRPQSIDYLPAWAETAFETAASTTAPAPEIAACRGAFTIMFAGNIGDAQDMPAVLAAAALLRHRPDIRWLIVGDGRSAAAMRAAIAAQRLDGEVTMLGRYPPERMPEFFAGADALLVSLKADPVFSMTIPGKMQTYMRAGKPILAMLDGEGAAVVREASAGLVAPAGDSAALARAAITLADMAPAERAAMGERGRFYCQREFDRRMLLRRLEGWLIETAAAKRGRP